MMSIVTMNSSNGLETIDMGDFKLIYYCSKEEDWGCIVERYHGCTMNHSESFFTNLFKDSIQMETFRWRLKGYGSMIRGGGNIHIPM
jgi:hypothetical protein